MLFNSYIFVFLFLPVTYLGYRLAQLMRHADASVYWLTACSFFFYSWWNPSYLALIVSSILFNYLVGERIAAHAQTNSGRWLLALGIAVNLLCLGYFKYANFLLDNLNALLGTHYSANGILLPLAISFFTFQQIAYLVDRWHRPEAVYHFKHYCLFVTFFPHLLAGPILRHHDIIPQFQQTPPQRNHSLHLVIGLTAISFGLFKKIIFADSLAYYSAQIFQRVHAGEAVPMLDAWIGAISFTLQIYFDFSAYSDIACGAAILFGVRLPQNFASPYRANSVIQFWQRWNMTLTAFINSHVYTPLVRLKREFSSNFSLLCIFITMVLVGLWHGGSWTCILFGVMQGAALVANHLWQRCKLKMPAVLGTTLMLLWWNFSLVLFRSANLHDSVALLASLFDLSSWSWQHTLHQSVINDFCRLLNWDIPSLWRLLPILLFLMAWVLYLPNLQQIMQAASLTPTALPNQPSRWHWHANTHWGVLTALALTAAVMGLHETGEFIYFQF